MPLAYRLSDSSRLTLADQLEINDRMEEDHSAMNPVTSKNLGISMDISPMMMDPLTTIGGSTPRQDNMNEDTDDGNEEGESYKRQNGEGKVDTRYKVIESMMKNVRKGNGDDRDNNSLSDIYHG